MKVKIGNKVIDSEDEPILIILDNQGKENIASMLPGATKYMSYPDTMAIEEAEEFMKI